MNLPPLADSGIEVCLPTRLDLNVEARVKNRRASSTTLEFQALGFLALESRFEPLLATAPLSNGGEKRALRLAFRLCPCSPARPSGRGYRPENGIRLRLLISSRRGTADLDRSQHEAIEGHVYLEKN